MRIGVDLGGTKTEVLLLGPEDEEIFRHRCATPKGDYTAILSTIKSLVLQAESKCGSFECGIFESGKPYCGGKVSVGIGIPGTLKRDGLVKNANTTCLIDKPLQQDLERLLDRPIKVANDANCFTLSETTDGAAQGEQTVFGVILGTGCGGGIVVNGKLVSGHNGIAGEWGHNPLPYLYEEGGANEEGGSIPNCYCGQKGCIETYVSGPAFVRDYARSKAKGAENGFVEGQSEYDGKSIVEAAEQGDPVAEACLTRLERRVAKSLAVVINILDPDVIVLGGGLSNISRLYQNIPQVWCNYIFSEQVETRLVQAVHGDSSGVRGAARL